MAEQITRTFIKTNATIAKAVIKAGKPELETLPTITLDGKAQETDIIKAAQKKHGKLTPIVVTAISYDETLYAMDVSFFLEHAKIVPSKEKPENKPDGESAE